LAKKAAAVAASLPSSGLLLGGGSISLARNPLEQSAALYYQNVQPKYLDGYILPGQRQFLFRCLYVPVFCKAVIQHVVKREGQPRYWLWQHGTYLLAFERLLLEMHLRKAIDLKAGVLNALVEPSLDRRYWHRRFNQWREAARASYRHFIQKKSPQIRKSVYAQAAHLGTMQNLSGGQLPGELFSTMLERINANPDAVAALKKTAGKTKPARWGEAELDTWLLEIWPLVTEYGWNYFDISLVANEKWDKTDPGAYESAEKFSDRCKKMLNLRLSPRGQSKQGRPKSLDEFKVPTLAPLAPLAMGIRSIGADEEEWIRGQCFTGKPG
jgi:hypothetical protein